MTESWRRGALPVMSWEPRPTVQPLGPDSDNTAEPGYTLSTIIDGTHDEYIDRYATAVRDLGLPVAIRFAHEMNGNWFPWSEERNGNAKGEYVQAWRHVHDRFTALGATNAIWIWSPNVVTARPSVRLAPLCTRATTTSTGWGWSATTGASTSTTRATRSRPRSTNTYQTTLDELRATAVKPIVITELGATEVGGNKPAWIRSLFDGLVDEPRHHRVRLVQPQRQRQRLADRVVGRVGRGVLDRGRRCPLPGRQAPTPETGGLTGKGIASPRCVIASPASGRTGLVSTVRPARRWSTPRSTR